MTTLAVEFSTLWADMSMTLKAYASEAHELRAQADNTLGTADVAEDIVALHSRLVMLRTAQDRIEGIASDLGRLRSRVRVAHSQALDIWNDKVAETALTAKVEEYATATERNARYNATAIEERIEARKLARMVADVEEVYEFVREKHRGVDGARRDIDLRFRMISFQTRLESS